MILNQPPSKSRVYFILATIITITILTIIINPMNTKLNLESLDATIMITDYIALFALILTLFGTAFSLFFRDKQNKLLKAQREQDQVNIVQSGERSEYAKKDAA